MSETPKAILVTGASGQVGTELLRLSPPAGWTLVGFDSAALDLTDAEAIAEAVQSRAWAAVINAGAYTAVDKAESQVAQAWRVNAVGPAVLAAETAKAGVPLVHISTDYVFDGSRDGAWSTDDPVRPLSVYGASKEGGEQGVRTGNPRHVIVRTAWVVSAHGANFVKTMLRVGAERPVLRVVDDQRGAPTSAADLAAALLTIAVRLAEDPAAATGTFHFSNSGAVTWAGFAREIFAQAALRGGASASVEPISTADYPTPARRPANSLLDTAALGPAFGVTPRAWQAALSDILDELVGTVT